MGPFFMRFVVLSCMFLSLLLGAWALIGYPMYTRVQASTWPAVAATVVESGVECSRYDGVEDCWVVLRAEYVVGEATHETSLIPAHGMETHPEARPRDDPRGFVDMFPVGAQVTVFHDPLRPSVAVFHRAPPIAWFKAGFTLLGVCLFYLAFLSRGWK